MDDSIEYFKAFTSGSTEIARRYLGLTDNNAEQAIQLFFDSPELASGLDQDQTSNAPPIPSSTRPQTHTTSASRQPTDLDSDNETMDVDDDEEEARALSQANALGRAADYEDDEAIARRMQEELYAGGDASGGFDADGVRAPIGRRAETLVGGPGGDWDEDDMHTAVMHQMRARQQPRIGQPGVFNQAPVASSSIWDENTDATTRRQVLAQATGGASEASSKAARLAELFRPPFELMRQVPWDTAREQGKDEQKWLLVNVQDQSIFDCQQLNRDIWKDQAIKEIVKESFIFLQYSKDDPRGAQYCRLYFQAKDSDAAYPHIAIVDPRTGEQVKVWSGPPVPSPSDFLMQLYEFLDRYSLDTTKKNPVAKRKAEIPKAFDVAKLSEEEMLDLALQNSLANNGALGPKEADPDDLTKSFTESGKGKEKEVEEASGPAQSSSQASVSEPTKFSSILSNNPHTEPPAGPGITRIQFKHSTGRIVRRFKVDDEVRRIYEWLKADPMEGKAGVEFDLKAMGKDLIDLLDETIEAAGLKQSTVMVEFLED